MYGCVCVCVCEVELVRSTSSSLDHDHQIICNSNVKREIVNGTVGKEKESKQLIVIY